MVKCKVTGRHIETTFLGKLLGTYIKDEKGKMYPVSREAQKMYPSKEELFKHFK